MRALLLGALLLVPAAAPAAPRASAPTRAPAGPRSAALPALDIVMVAGEAVPFIKTGGLADVTDALSRGLAERGHRVSLFLPKYESLDTAGLSFERLPQRVEVPLGAERLPARVLRARHEGVEVFLLENDALFAGDNPYAESGYEAGPGSDDRFAFFARGVLETLRSMGRKPDVLHAHDWHGALVAPMSKLLYPSDRHVGAAKSVVTIHNAAFQGHFPKETLAKAGFSEADFTYDRLEHHGAFNFLKSGLQFADAITTVSPTYARELRDDPDKAMGLQEVFQHRSSRLHGILNGVDPALWSPRADASLPRPYGAQDAAQGKAASKAAIQELGGLTPDPSAPLFSIVSRLTGQKGIDLAAETAPEFLDRGGQLAVLGLGTGEPHLDDLVLELIDRYPGQVFARGFDLSLPRLVFAASDFLLMPSRFEPCGLSQLMAQRYGSLPIVNPTGGLADTVTDLSRDPAQGDGFVMKALSAQALREAVMRALALHASPQRLAAARRTAMEKDSSWGPSVQRYEELYRDLLAEPAARRSAAAWLWGALRRLIGR